MHLIDSHCHLFASEFSEDRKAVIDAAKSSGVHKLLLPNIDVNSIEAIIQTTLDFPEVCLPMMGLHPCSVQAGYETQLMRIEQELNSGKFIAVGEIGLDFYWDNTFKEQQIDVFRKQVRWAKSLKLPVVIHTRNSFAEALAIIQEEKTNDLTGVFHCFGGTFDDAKKVIELDFFMGIGGVLTFKNSGLDKVAANIPLEYLLLETDSPYLAPAPHRGKRNEPANLKLIALKLAEVLKRPFEEVAAITTANTKRLFGIS